MTLCLAHAAPPQHSTESPPLGRLPEDVCFISVIPFEGSGSSQSWGQSERPPFSCLKSPKGLPSSEPSQVPATPGNQLELHRHSCASLVILGWLQKGPHGLTVPSYSAGRQHTDSEWVAWFSPLPLDNLPCPWRSRNCQGTYQCGFKCAAQMWTSPTVEGHLRPSVSSAIVL